MNFKHGYSNHPLVKNVWNAMIRRCHNKKAKDYARYGGRGIIVCEEWRHDKMTFVKWCEDNGWRKGLQVDRKNNNGGYSPSNCRITTGRVNCNNKQNNVIVEIFGEQLTFMEAYRKYGLVEFRTAQRRFGTYGWDLMEALQSPLQKPSRKPPGAPPRYDRY